ncbi:MAG: hypothetical protein KIT82_02350 [Bradyrhizobium sp.]|nr:hypothetical protein [Bradyrhizobium sp.]
MQQIIGNISVLEAAPILNLGLLIDGLLIGAIFALAAYGLALVWGVMNVKNLAQGDFIMTGGYIAWFLGITAFIRCSDCPLPAWCCGASAGFSTGWSSARSSRATCLPRCWLPSASPSSFSRDVHPPDPTPTGPVPICRTGPSPAA